MTDKQVELIAALIDEDDQVIEAVTFGRVSQLLSKISDLPPRSEQRLKVLKLMDERSLKHLLLKAKGAGDMDLVRDIATVLQL